MTSRVTMLRWTIATTLLLIASASALPSQKVKRQVTYQDDASGAEQNTDVHLVHPVTKKPLPAQVVYPGDLRNFFTTEKPEANLQAENNATTDKSQSKLNSSGSSSSTDNSRIKRSMFMKTKKDGSTAVILKLEKPMKSSNFKLRQPEVSESRLHSSYHKPSVSVMNDIPAEMYFDGAGFLRYEDDSEETKTSPEKSHQYDRSPSRSYHDNNKALRDFREAFNISHERGSTDIKYDDESHYPDSSVYTRTSQERIVDHGAQETENGTPLGIDFMNAYQREMFANMQNNYAQMAQNPSSFQQDPFSFSYPNFYNAQPNFNQMPSPVIQQEPLLQNHRLQSTANVAGTSAPTVYASSSQPVHANSGYASNINYPQYHKVQRKRRSAMRNKRADQGLASASEPNPDHYQYSRIADHQDSSSGFIPITGSFNGGTLQLNFPVFGGNPAYSPRPPMQTYTYSVPVQPEGRPYRNTMERFYHPSEARRYSYGILGSGNFEVIRGGVFPGERHSGFSGGYQGGRMPYANNDFGNYGTTEIILDGPIQGFQGFDNFPAHLINALSKHSELAVHPDRRETEDLS